MLNHAHGNAGREDDAHTLSHAAFAKKLLQTKGREAVRQKERGRDGVKVGRRDGNM